MADEQKTKPIFGKKAEESDNKPATNAEQNATATTTPETNAEVSDAEAKALDGAAGPNRTPAFAKRDFEDENVQLTDTDDLQSAKRGAAANSAKSQVDIAGLEAAASVGPEREGAEDEVVYTSHPVSNFRLGRHQFTNGVLRLKEDDVEGFEKALASASMRTQQTVRKIDRSGGEAVARRYLETNGGTRTRDVDTTANSPEAPSPQSNQ